MIPMKQTYSFNFFHIYGIYGVSESVVHLEKKTTLLHSSYCSCHFLITAATEHRSWQLAFVVRNGNIASLFSKS